MDYSLVEENWLLIYFTLWNLYDHHDWITLLGSQRMYSMWHARGFPVVSEQDVLSSLSSSFLYSATIFNNHLESCWIEMNVSDMNSIQHARNIQQSGMVIHYYEWKTQQKANLDIRTTLQSPTLAAPPLHSHELHAHTGIPHADTPAVTVYPRVPH